MTLGETVLANLHRPWLWQSLIFHIHNTFEAKLPGSKKTDKSQPHTVKEMVSQSEKEY